MTHERHRPENGSRPARGQPGAGIRWTSDRVRYGALAIGLHWLTLLLVVAVYGCIELREFFPKGSDPRAALKTGHFMLGLAVLVMVSVRLAVHLAGAVPRIEPVPGWWPRLLGTLMHIVLYVLLIVLPLLGWSLLSAEGKTVPFFGLALPPLVDANADAAALFKGIHEAGATICYVLIGLHAAAALYHHYILRDNTLRRMLPRRP